jgi:hypothetical protein
MDLGQTVRAGLASVKRLVTPRQDTDPFATADVPPPAATAPGDRVSGGSSGTAPAEAAAAAPAKPGGWRKWAIVGAVALIPLYYFLGSLLTHRINDDLDFRPADPGPTASKTVAVMAGLIDREVNETAWVPNAQFFEPGALLRYGGNMVNFQSGLLRSLSVTTLELEGRLARSRGTSAADVDLGKARQGLAFSPDSWTVVPFIPGDAAREYDKARQALQAYNVRVAGGQAIFDIRSDNLQGVLERIALDMGALSDQIDGQVVAGRRVFIDRRADKLFYFAKGQSYGYFMVLRALRDDFAPVIEERRVRRIYDEMLTELAEAARLQPLIVQNAAPNALLVPNHLTTQGFYLMRARAKLREITDILQR